MKLGVQEEPAIYKVLTQRATPRSRSLRSLGTWSGGGTPSKSVAAFWTGGTIPWVSPKDMKVARIRDTEDRITAEAVVSSATNLVKAGAVILVVRSGILKHSLPVAVTDVDVALNQDMKALQPASDVEATYVAWALRANTQRILHGCTKAGTTVQSIEMPALLDFEIPLPSPDEQRHIVEIVEARLSLLDASVAGLHRVQANLKRYRASVLKTACEGRLVPTEAELARQEGHDFETGAQLLQRILAHRLATAAGKHKEAVVADTASSPCLPAGWTWASLGQIGMVVSGLTKNPKREKLELKLPYLRVANVYADELRLSEVERIGVADLELEKLLVLKDDLLIVEGNGSPDQIGRVALWDGSISPCAHQNHLIKVRLQTVNARWVMNWLLSPEGRNQIERVSSSTSGLHTLSTGKVARLAIPLPPLAEQHRIVAEADRRLSLVRAAEAQVTANLARAQRLRQSILRAAFVGPD